MPRKGRPSLFDIPKIKEIAINAALLGHIDEEIAKLIDITVSTLQRWMSLNPNFSEAIKEAKKKSNQEIALSLRKRALGYTYIKNSINKDGDPVSVEVDVPPDTTACIFWLKNREPSRWRDVQDGRIDVNHQINWGSFIKQCEEEGNGTGKNRIAGLATLEKVN